MHDRIHLCDVCGKEPVVGVACSPLGPVSFGYCRSCLDAGYEPMMAITGSLYGIRDFDGLTPEAATIIRKSIQFHGVTEAELWIQVEEFSHEYEAALTKS